MWTLLYYTRKKKKPRQGYIGLRLIFVLFLCISFKISVFIFLNFVQNIFRPGPLNCVHLNWMENAILFPNCIQEELITKTMYFQI